MYKLLLIILFASACTTQRTISFDPFNYDPQAYEKVELFYKMEGKGDTTLFFIHGWNLDHTIWQSQTAEFLPFYRIVLPDMAGCGKSGNNRRHWTVESFAKDITTIINNAHLTNVILVAHSMGGEIAVDAALANPGRVIGIIGIDNLKNVGMTIMEEDKKGMQPYIKNFIKNYSGMAEGMAREFVLSKDSAIVHKIVDSYKNADPSIAVPTLMNLYPRAADVKNKLPRLSFPMKFIMSANTPYDEEAFRKYCTHGYKIVTVDSTGHFPMMERPIEFNRALHQLLLTL